MQVILIFRLGKINGISIKKKLSKNKNKKSDAYYFYLNQLYIVYLPEIPIIHIQRESDMCYGAFARFP